MPERRRHQYLADNRNTPFDMLAELAANEDPDIRRRVGRNESTPEPIVRMLAGDGRWQVRQGAAENRKAPEDVLAALARDRSVAVRCTAKGNPRTPRPQLKAVTAGISHDGDQDSQPAGDAAAEDTQTNPSTLTGTALEPSPIRINQDRHESALDTAGSRTSSSCSEADDLCSRYPGRAIAGAGRPAGILAPKSGCGRASRATS